MNGRQNAIHNVLGALDGARIPGGCEECNAYQAMTVVGGGVYKLEVFHDDWCPVLRRIEEQR